MVAEIDHLWVVEQLIATAVGDSRASHILAATGRPPAWSSDVCSSVPECAPPTQESACWPLAQRAC